MPYIQLIEKSYNRNIYQIILCVCEREGVCVGEHECVDGWVCGGWVVVRGLKSINFIII